MPNFDRAENEHPWLCKIRGNGWYEALSLQGLGSMIMIESAQ